MENFEQKLKSLPEPEFPSYLHNQIMQKIIWRRMIVSVTGVISVIVINLAISSLYFWKKLGDSELIAIVRSSLEGFQTDYSLIIDSLKIIAETLPLASFGMFMFNLIIVVYIAFFYIRMKEVTK